jgi:site-specific DNA-methyltransferase (adenine-specific)
MVLNQVFHGDCLTELVKIPNGSIDLIYLDPPFFTQKKQSLKTRDNSTEYYFNDVWNDIQSYSNYIKVRLLKCRQVLKPTGSIFLHCDRSASHYLRIALDEVFGFNNFQSEIVWFYRRWSNAKRGLLNSHQVIYFYSKCDQFKFNFLFDDYSLTTNIDQIFQKRVRDQNGKTKYKTGEGGEYELVEAKKGIPLSDVWDIPYLNPKAKERSGYPTQKPILLLERIIQLTTDRGDLVLDPFCGSGTTLVAAKLLGRNVIGIDISKDAIELSQKRLDDPIKTSSHLMTYGRSAYLNQDPNVASMLEHIGAVPVQRNKGIDGFLKIQESIVPIPVRVQREQETIEEAKQMLVKASQKNKFRQKILIKTSDCNNISLFEMDKKQENSDILVVDDINAFLANRDVILNRLPF